MEKQNPKLKGALLTFVVLQLCYLFFFFISFPDSFRNALAYHYGALDAVAAWLSTLTMLAYCVCCLVSVASLVMRKHVFLLWFQVSGAIALVGNFVVYILRQIAGGSSTGSSFYTAGDYYWTLFIMALFWTVIWCMYFARSSRVYTYMGEDSTYLRAAFFTKRVKEPTPWAEPKPAFPMYGQPQPPPAYQPPYQPQPAPRPPQPPMAAPEFYQPPVQQAPPMGWQAPPAPPPAPSAQPQPGAYPPPAGQPPYQNPPGGGQSGPL